MSLRHCVCLSNNPVHRNGTDFYVNISNKEQRLSILIIIFFVLFVPCYGENHAGLQELIVNMKFHTAYKNILGVESFWIRSANLICENRYAATSYLVMIDFIKSDWNLNHTAKNILMFSDFHNGALRPQ